jgi:regulator of RNase E activity RraA
MNKAGKLLGPAFTVKVPEGDNLMLNKAMDMAESGDVLVIDAFGYPSRAIFGEIIVNFCRRRGIAGIIVDGAIRDADAIAAVNDFPVYAIGVCPNGPYHNGPGTIGYPVSCAGQVVFPGDIIVGDGDGVMAIRPEDAEEAAALALAVGKKEEGLLRGISESGVYPRSWVDEKLDELKCVR